MPYSPHKISTPLQLTDEQIHALEQQERKDLHFRGAVVFTSLDDKFTVYPEAGYSGTGTLQQQCGIDFHNEDLTYKERTKTFKLRYYRNGPTYDASLYCRIPTGVEHNVSNGLTRFLNWKMEGLTPKDRWRKYKRLVNRGRDIILPRLLYQFKDDEKQPWQYVFRTEYHGNIKYASDIITGGSRRQRVASPHRPSAAAAAALQPPPPPPPKHSSRTARPLPPTPTAKRIIGTPKRPSSMPPETTPAKRKKSEELVRHPSKGVQPLTPTKADGPKRPVATPTPVKGTASKVLRPGQEESPVPEKDVKAADEQPVPVRRKPSVTITVVPPRSSAYVRPISGKSQATTTTKEVVKIPVRRKRPATITPIPSPTIPESEAKEQFNFNEVPESEETPAPAQDNRQTLSQDLYRDDFDDAFIVDYDTEPSQPTGEKRPDSKVTFDPKSKTTSGSKRGKRPPSVDAFEALDVGTEESMETGDDDVFKKPSRDDSVHGDYDPEVANAALKALDDFLPDNASEIPNWKSEGKKFDEFYRRLLVFEDAAQHAISGRRVRDVNPGKPLTKKQRSAQNTRIRGLVKEKKARKKEANKKLRQQVRQTKLDAAKKIRELERAGRERMSVVSSTYKSTDEGSVYKPSTTDETTDTASGTASDVIVAVSAAAARSKTRHVRAKEPKEEDDIRDILKVIIDNQKELTKSVNEVSRKVTNDLTDMKEDNNGIKDSIQKLEELHVKTSILMMNREVQLRTAETRAKNKLFRFLPLDQVGEDVETLFESPVCQRALQELILRKLLLKNVNAPDEAEVVKVCFDTCWTQNMQAHFHWREPTRDPEVSEGWEKIRMSPAFIEFHNNCILDLVQRGSGSPKKRTKDDGGGGSKSVAAQKLYNARTACFNNAGKDATTRRSWIAARYENKIEFFRQHYNPEREGLEIQEPDLDFEIEVFYKYTRTASIKTIDDPLPAQRTQETFSTEKGKPLDKVALKDAIDELRTLGYDKPFAVNRDEWERMFDWGDMRLFIDRTIDDRVEKGLAKKMKAIDNRGFLSKNEVAASKSGEEAHTETQTIVMSGGKITEVINTDERNNVKRQLFVNELVGDRDVSSETEVGQPKNDDKNATVDSLKTMSDFDE